MPSPQSIGVRISGTKALGSPTLRRLWLAIFASLLLSVPTFAQPPGDICETALPITIPGVTEGNTCGYANNYDEMCPYDAIGPDRVYVFVPAEDMVLDFTMCVGITDYDTKLLIFQNGCQTWNDLVACNDDYCTAPNYPYPYVSRLDSIVITADSTYYIVVDGYGNECGNYTLQVTPWIPPPDPPENLIIRTNDPPHIHLSWDASEGATIYYLSYATDLHDDLPSAPLATTSDTFYVDSNVVNQPPPRRLYLVRAGNQ